MTDAEAEQAYRDAPEIPLSEERIAEIMDYVRRKDEEYQRAVKLLHLIMGDS